MLGKTINKMYIERLIMQETGTYNPMFLRPYETNVNGETLNAIANRVQAHGTAKFTGALISGVASSIVAPTATPTEEIAIPNGWGERRVRFILIVHCEHNFGSHVIYYLQGYTTYPGVTPNGAVAPDMEFVVNSILGVTRVEQMTPMGITSRDMIFESYQVLAGTNWSHPYQGFGERFMMRPQDIFTGMHANYLRNSYGVDDPNSINDTRTMLRREPFRSTRDNNVPASYLAKIIDAYNSGTQLSSVGQNEQDIVSMSRDTSAEPLLSENPFFMALGNLRGTGLTNRFTFGDLERIDMNVSAVTDYLVLGQTFQTQVHSTGMTSFWNGSDRETVVATVLSQAVPALMMELMISRISFTMTNHDIGGAVSIVLSGVKGMTNADMSRQCELFKRRLEKEIMFDLTFNNQEPFMLEMRADMFGETWINLSLGSNPLTQYVTPSFCDTLYAPVVSANRNSFNTVVDDLDRLVNGVVDAVNTNTVGTTSFSNLV